MNSVNLTDNVIEMMTERIKSLDPETQQMLSIAAAIGNRFDMSTLSAVSQRSVDQTANALWPAIKGDSKFKFRNARETISHVLQTNSSCCSVMKDLWPIRT